MCQAETRTECSARFMGFLHVKQESVLSDLSTFSPVQWAGPFEFRRITGFVFRISDSTPLCWTGLDKWVRPSEKLFWRVNPPLRLRGLSPSRWMTPAEVGHA